MYGVLRTEQKRWDEDERLLRAGAPTLPAKSRTAIILRGREHSTVEMLVTSVTLNLC